MTRPGVRGGGLREKFGRMVSTGGETKWLENHRPAWFHCAYTTMLCRMASEWVIRIVLENKQAYCRYVVLRM